MINNRTTGHLTTTGRWLAAAAVLGVAVYAQADEPAEVLALDVMEDPAQDGSLDLRHYQPGFSLAVADEALQKQMKSLSGFLEQADWAKAFRLLTEMGDDQLQTMVAKGVDGQYVLVKEQLQRQLLSLSPDGLRAFRLYFDGQAMERFDSIKNHPLPGSDDQLVQAQALVDRLLASSVGGEAAALLGDILFERGLFDQADRAWQLALEHGSATGQAALTLQTKRILAMKRAGNTVQAYEAFEGLLGRYSQASIQAGGGEVDALKLLSQSLDQTAIDQAEDDNDATFDRALPSPEAEPAWHLRFIDRRTRNILNQSQAQHNHYSPPTDIAKFIPPIVADDERVYFHWLGVVFALDRDTGKLLWQDGSMKETAETIASRIQSRKGDPRNYQIAVSDGVLLVSQASPQNNSSPFTLKAYDATNGQLRWSSDSRQGWPFSNPQEEESGMTTLLGQVLIHEGRGYAVVSPLEKNVLSLRRFDPATGKVDWTITLGRAEVTAFQYTNVSRMPQPKLMMGPSLLYVLTNNGALIAVDVIAREMKWAVRMDPPFGIGQNEGQNNFRSNLIGRQINTMANPNGSGRLLLQDSTLYAKEHNSKTLYALHPSTGKVKWKVGQLKPDARLIGVDDQRFYLMDRALQCYEITGNHDLVTKNGNDTNSPDHAKPIVTDKHILIYASGKLRRFDKTHLDPAGRYDSSDYLGAKGGHLYTLGDLLIAIDTTQITAFKIQPTVDTTPPPETNP